MTGHSAFTPCGFWGHNSPPKNIASNQKTENTLTYVSCRLERTCDCFYLSSSLVVVYRKTLKLEFLQCFHPLPQFSFGLGQKIHAKKTIETGSTTAAALIKVSEVLRQRIGMILGKVDGSITDRVDNTF